MQLQWYKCADGEWCRLDQIDTAAVGDYGVFIIWRNGNLAHASSVLYVGKGDLVHEIARCRRDRTFHGHPELKITWARVDDIRTVDAIAAYLYQHLRPMWGEVVPSLVPPLAVNLPAA